MNPRPLPLILVGLIAHSAAFAATSVLPEPLPADRYQKMVQDSPFIVARVEAPTALPEPKFTQNLYVMGIAKMRDAEGKEKDFVTIKSSADQTTFSLFSSEPNKEGVELTGIEWSDQVGKSKVMLKKGSDFETLLFDQANLRTQPTVPNGVPPRPGSPGVPPPRMGGTVMPNNVQPMIGGQKPRIQPIVPRPNSVPPGINQPQPQAVPKAGAVGPGVSPGPSSDQRKRIRVINSNPGGI